MRSMRISYEKDKEIYRELFQIQYLGSITCCNDLLRMQ